ncbi:MAG: formylglycine-generating enzyme family protein [Desulfobacterales bacterium]|nr:formylglycine-generating enzyme family protein [Desulfobacterales bacterium]
MILIESANTKNSIQESFILENIPVPSYSSLWQIANNYSVRADVINTLMDHLSISKTEAMKRVVVGAIRKQGIDIEASVPLRDFAIELLNCMKLVRNLFDQGEKEEIQVDVNKKDKTVLKTRLCENVEIEFVLIPAGTFMMGTNEYSSATPVHQVTISKSFYLGKYPVTQQQWVTVMRSHPSNFKGSLQTPIEKISYNDVQKFIIQLNQFENRYRLPTEAEWEYACRSGTTTRYYFGDNKDQLYKYAWYKRNSGNKTYPVGQLQPNAWGLYDMCGNVWEWCSDWYGPYPTTKLTDPIGPISGTLRILRGGSSSDDEEACCPSSRAARILNQGFSDCGFRLVAVPN